MFNILMIFTLSLGIYQTIAQQWISPCPRLFSYDPAGIQEDTWNGDITLRTDQELAGIWTLVVFSGVPIEVKANFSEVVRIESDEYLIRDVLATLQPSETKKIRLTVKFNNTISPPRFLGFRLNARVRCPENGVLEKGMALSPSSSLPRLVSPCPRLFSYDPLGIQGDTWNGDITLRTDQELEGIWNLVVFSRPPILVEANFSEVVKIEPDEFLIRDVLSTLKPGQSKKIHLTVKFNTSAPVPTLLGFRLNARVRCPENGVLEKTITTSLPITVSEMKTESVTKATLVQPPSKSNEESVDMDEIFKPDFMPGRNPILGGMKKPILSPAKDDIDEDPDFISKDKILVFPKFYYVIKTFPQFAIIDIKRRRKGERLSTGDSELPFDL